MKTLKGGYQLERTINIGQFLIALSIFILALSIIISTLLLIAKGEEIINIVFQIVEQL